MNSLGVVGLFEQVLRWGVSIWQIYPSQIPVFPSISIDFSLHSTSHFPIHPSSPAINNKPLPPPPPFSMPINPINPIPPISSLPPSLPPRPHRLSKLLQHLNRRLPANTRIRNTDALLEVLGSFGRDLLAAFIDVGLDHDADDGGLAGAELLADGEGDFRLVGVVFLGVAWGWVRSGRLGGGVDFR